MDTREEQPCNNIYSLKSQITAQQIFDAIHVCLCKAGASAVTAATTDFKAYTSEIIDNYLWALSDIIQEAKWLHERATLIKI